MPAPGDAYGNEVWADTPAWWPRLDEPFGTSAQDHMGGASGTIGGSPSMNQPPAILTGKSILFDGTDDTVSFADATPQKPSVMTLETWVTVDAAIADFSPLIVKANAAWTNGYGMAWVSGNLRFWINHYTIQAGALSNHIDVALIFGAAHHVVGTYNGSVIRLYVDGAEVSGSPLTLTAAITHDTGPLRVAFDGLGDFWKGKIDEPAVYPTVLSAGRVGAHYTTGSGTVLYVNLAGVSAGGGADTGNMTVVTGSVPSLTARRRSLDETEDTQATLTPHNLRSD